MWSFAQVCYEPESRCVFVSQMSNSVLVRIPLGDDGLLIDDQDAWKVGEEDPATGNGVSGMHNISRSYAHPVGQQLDSNLQTHAAGVGVGWRWVE